MLNLDLAKEVARVTLDRAPVNAINAEWVAGFHRLLDDLGRRADWHVLHIRSARKVFCAGADLAEMRARFAAPGGVEALVEGATAMQHLFARIEALPQVTLAEIGGAALGGGFELALACDLRMVADSARIGLPEARLGLLPAAGGTQRLTRICGDAIARRLILGAELVSGNDVLGLGLAQWLVPAREIETAARALVGRIAELPAEALAECKRCIGVALDGSGDGFEAELDGSAKLLASPETQRRVDRFLDKSR